LLTYANYFEEMRSRGQVFDLFPPQKLADLSLLS
jgi:hypothetical protein